MSKHRRLIVLVVFGVFFLFVVLDSLGVFDTSPYSEIPHGNHTHYRPKDCNPPLPVDQSPTRPPGPGEKINCQGQFVPE